MKKCKSCEIEKPDEDYYLNPRTKSGLSTYCKKCTSEKNNKWQSDNPDKKREYNRRRKLKQKLNNNSLSKIQLKITRKEKRVMKLLAEIKSLKDAIKAVQS